jgi:hypothetical protein
VHANSVKNIAKSLLLPSAFTALARIVMLSLYRLALLEIRLMNHVVVQVKHNPQRASNNNGGDEYCEEERDEIPL